MSVEERNQQTSLENFTVGKKLDENTGWRNLKKEEESTFGSGGMPGISDGTGISKTEEDVGGPKKRDGVVTVRRWARKPTVNGDAGDYRVREGSQEVTR